MWLNEEKPSAFAEGFPSIIPLSLSLAILRRMLDGLIVSQGSGAIIAFECAFDGGVDEARHVLHADARGELFDDDIARCREHTLLGHMMARCFAGVDGHGAAQQRRAELSGAAAESMVTKSLGDVRTKLQ